MITNNERRFINEWVEQKSGPRWKYYLLFGLAWTAVSFLVIFFLTKLFTSLWATGGANLIYIFIIISLVTGFLYTHFTYVTNEKKYHKIIDKEKRNAN
jgi:cation transporter-like permease